MDELMKRLADAERRIEKLTQAVLMLADHQTGAAREVASEVQVEIADAAEAGTTDAQRLPAGRTD